MKGKKIWWLVAGLAFGLIGLLLFQIQWLLTSAELKENQFQHRVTMALCSAVDELSKDKEVCSALASCSIKKGTGLVEFVGLQNSNHIENLVGQYLRFYQINTPYDVTLSKDMNTKSLSYAQAKIKNAKNAMIHVDFPSRQDFILSELNGMFITSFLLIGLLIVVCVATLQWMFRQQKIQTATVDYIDGMSHELKTPINNISLALAMLEKQFSEGQAKKVDYYMDVAKKENESLRDKINEALGTASLERILGENKRDLCDIHDLIQQAHKRLSVRAEELNATIETKLLARKHAVRADQTELLNVLICLIDNALTYTERDPDVAITTTTFDQEIKIRIKDNGVGIPEEMHEQVFEKYFRQDHVEPGYGIGLFLVKKIIQAHAGCIDLESTLGSGSVFTITLPMSV